MEVITAYQPVMEGGCKGNIGWGKIALALVTFGVLASGFLEIGHVVAGAQSHDLSLVIDRMIPLSPGWIWIYLLYYPFCLLPLFFPCVVKENRLFAAIGAGFLIQFFVAWLAFYFFPTHIFHLDIAPTMPSGLALRGLYEVDAGYNDFPSLHVANSIYVAFVSTIFFPKRHSALMFLAALLIAASTLFIKQHFFLDVPAGFALGFAGYALARVWIERKILPHNESAKGRAVARPRAHADHGNVHEG